MEMEHKSKCRRITIQTYGTDTSKAKLDRLTQTQEEMVVRSGSGQICEKFQTDRAGLKPFIFYEASESMISFNLRSKRSPANSCSLRFCTASSCLWNITYWGKPKRCLFKESPRKKCTFWSLRGKFGFENPASVNKLKLYKNQLKHVWISQAFLSLSYQKESKIVKFSGYWKSKETIKEIGRRGVNSSKVFFPWRCFSYRRKDTNTRINRKQFSCFLVLLFIHSTTVADLTNTDCDHIC